MDGIGGRGFILYLHVQVCSSLWASFHFLHTFFQADSFEIEGDSKLVVEGEATRLAWSNFQSIHFDTVLRRLDDASVSGDGEQRLSLVD